MRIKLNTKIMRRFSGITNVYTPEAVSSDNIQPEQMIVIVDKAECSPRRAGINIQPYRTEFRNIYK